MQITILIERKANENSELWHTFIAALYPLNELDCDGGGEVLEFSNSLDRNIVRETIIYSDAKIK